MSDIKYRTKEHLENTISYEKQRANTAKLRIEEAEKELKKREKNKDKDLEELTNGILKAITKRFPYSQQRHDYAIELSETIATYVKAKL